MSKQKVALMVKVYNEQFFLNYMLDYYETLGVDGIFIFDDGSTDETYSMLKEWEESGNNRLMITQSDPKEVWFDPEVSEGELINEAIEIIKEAGFDWVFKLDADEVFSIGTQRLINQIQRGRAVGVHGYNFPRIHYVGGLRRRIWGNYDDSSTWYPDYNTRAFNLNINDWRHSEIKQLDTQLFPVKRPAHIVTLSDDHIIHHFHFLFEGRRIVRHGVLEEDDGFYIKTSNYDIIDVDEKDNLRLPVSFIDWYLEQIEHIKDRKYGEDNEGVL